MVIRAQPVLPPGLLARVTEAMALSPLSFYKRYRPSCETPTPSSLPLVVSPTLPSWKRYQGTYEIIADTDTESEESKGEGTNSESEEAAFEDQQQVVPVEDTTVDEPLGLGYGVVADETPTPRLPVRPIWVDPENGTIYLDIEFDLHPEPQFRLQHHPSAMWQTRYEDHRLILNDATQRELQELRDRVTSLEQERSRREE
uniref:Uncharacterized protein n=1 Tax=Tanacetum cinerariifolium TaxID=118510 RepID=A0A6L2ND27_TANCI|nr:hypothetical protein [Tanacetum cinerariifolium]